MISKKEEKKRKPLAISTWFTEQTDNLVNHSDWKITASIKSTVLYELGSHLWRHFLFLWARIGLTATTIVTCLSMLPTWTSCVLHGCLNRINRQRSPALDAWCLSLTELWGCWTVSENTGIARVKQCHEAKEVSLDSFLVAVSWLWANEGFIRAKPPPCEQRHIWSI